MISPNIESAVSGFAYDGRAVSSKECKSGHINGTYFVDCLGQRGATCRYVLQQINTAVFKNPHKLMSNIINVTEHIKNKLIEEGKDPSEGTIDLVETKDGGYIFVDDYGKVWRSYRYIEGHSYQSANDPELMERAGKIFGHFQMQLSDFDASKLYETIPNFHNTISRIADFREAVKKDLSGRAELVREEIDFILSRSDKGSYIMDGIAEGLLPIRVTHNDTKLNNIMMKDDGGCVIDLDTVMPGSVIADFGDAIRFGASSAAEDEGDLSKVYVRLDMFEGFTKGYIAGLQNSLTPYEVESFPMGAYLMTYEVAMRFLGDYINGDTYFRTEYSDHNLVRARNQMKLLADMEEKMAEMQNIVRKYL